MNLHYCEHEPCGREFLARRIDQRFCSVWCRRAAWRDVNGVQSDSGRLESTSGTDLAAKLFEASQARS